MRLAIQSSGFGMTNALRSHTEQRLANSLGWARQRMRKLAVRLSDVNGPRGGIDKRCKIQIQLDNGREVIIEEREADLYAAIAHAAERAGCTIGRQVERRHNVVHQRMSYPVENDDGDDKGNTLDRSGSGVYQ
jgi:putative sigma-54 modulation protein